MCECVTSPLFSLSSFNCNNETAERNVFRVPALNVVHRVNRRQSASRSFIIMFVCLLVFFVSLLLLSLLLLRFNLIVSEISERKKCTKSVQLAMDSHPPVCTTAHYTCIRLNAIDFLWSGVFICSTNAICFVPTMMTTHEHTKTAI